VRTFKNFMAVQANLDHNEREREMHTEDNTYQMKLNN